MSTDVTKETPKGRLSWVIPLSEVIVAVAYLAIGFSGIADACKNFDFEGMFKSVEIAILCFVPIFKSKSNVKVAIWNIIWIAFTIYSLI